MEPALDSAHSLDHAQEHERPERLFYAYVDRGIDEAFSEVEQRFEQDSNPENNLDFHRKKHTQGTVVRTEKILRTIQETQPELVTEKDIALGRLIAARHDTVQNWNAVELDFPGFDQKRLFRQRHLKENELSSANDLVAMMKKANNDAGVIIFTEQDMQTGLDAIKGTIPGYDSKLNTVVQPHLAKEANLIVRAIALADLGGAGIDGPETFRAEGDALFREENLDIAKDLREKRALGDEDKEFYRARMLAWTKSQADFALGRKLRLAEELPVNINIKTRQKLLDLFSHFDESISNAKALAEQRSQMSFEELVDDFGY